jgi:GntR family transcriptional regulator
LKRSPIPLYFQLSCLLEDQIKSGTFESGTPLPSEKRLAKDHDVSLITVRAAMKILLDKKLVVRYPGKGTFVCDPKNNVRTWAIGSLNDLVMTGYKSTMKLLWHRRVIPPQPVAERLQVPQRQKIYTLRTVRETEDGPFMLTDTYHPYAIATRLKRSDFTGKTAQSQLVISIVEEKCGLSVSHVRQMVRVERATQDVNRALNVAPGEPLLIIEREYFGPDFELIQIAIAHYRTDRYRYFIELSTFGESQPLSGDMDHKTPTVVNHADSAKKGSVLPKVRGRAIGPQRRKSKGDALNISTTTRNRQRRLN